MSSEKRTETFSCIASKVCPWVKFIAADRALENRSKCQSLDVFLSTNQPVINICLIINLNRSILTDGNRIVR